MHETGAAITDEWLSALNENRVPFVIAFREAIQADRTEGDGLAIKTACKYCPRALRAIAGSRREDRRKSYTDLLQAARANATAALFNHSGGQQDAVSQEKLLYGLCDCSISAY
jgi:hypothetical protein